MLERNKEAVLMKQKGKKKKSSRERDLRVERDRESMEKSPNLEIEQQNSVIINEDYDSGQ